MYFYTSSFFFCLDGLLMAVFCYNRYTEYGNNPSNRIIYRYYYASLYVSIALLMYGVIPLISQESQILSLAGSLGLIFNAIGFSNFLLIPSYDWLSRNTHTITKYILFALIPIIGALLVTYPPQTVVDTIGVTHWNFGPLLGSIATIQMDIAFGLNIILLVTHFYRLKKLSVFNSIALITAFSATGISGAYLYLGNNSHILILASVGLTIGIGSVFLSVVRGKINSILGWQYHEGPPSSTVPYEN
jgi:uncharacterized membrane protein YidH (DUF202 family)